MFCMQCLIVLRLQQESERRKQIWFEPAAEVGITNIWGWVQVKIAGEQKFDQSGIHYPRW